jgi:nitrogen fixation/metabolism regulation signal transduction histidine kinase
MAEQSPPQGGRHQRQLRNYLLDARFQLKYTGYLVGIALVLSAVLGAVLLRTSNAVVAQSQEAVRVAEGSVHVGEQVVDQGREVVRESEKVSAVVRMNIVKDPVYKDNPALLEAFQEDAERQDNLLVEQQQKLEAQSRSLRQQSTDLRAQSELIEQKHRVVTLALIVLLAALVFGVGVAGIIVTHKVAGPIFKMKRQIRELGEGSLKVPSPLRKGDELVEFFEEFRTAITRLRGYQSEEIALLDQAIVDLGPKVPDTDLAPLRAVRQKMQDALER